MKAELKPEEQSIIDKSIKKFDKGWDLKETYSYGIPYWRWVKNKQTSNYPRINEDAFCVLLSQHIIYEASNQLYRKRTNL